MTATEKLIGKFLSKFYLIAALTAKLISSEQKREIYELLARIYCIDKEPSAERYWELSERAPYSEMSNLSDYERECRLISYAALMGKDIGMTADDRIILAAKGEALRRKQDMLSLGKHYTADALSDGLLAAAGSGNIHALGAVAFLEYYGIAIGFNKKRARKNIEKGIRWNNLDCILLKLAERDGSGEECIRKLATVYGYDDDMILTEHIASYYSLNIPSERDKNTALLEKAFMTGAAQRELYDMKVDSLVYTELLTAGDKRRIIENYKRETAPLYHDLPTHIDMDAEIKVDYTALDGVKLRREGELRKIKRNLAGAVSGDRKRYKPLLLISKDPYVLGMYEKAIKKALKGTPCITLDAGLLTAADLSMTKDNVFLRSVSDAGQMAHAFLIEGVEKLSEGGIRELIKYVRGDMRSAFRLSAPQVTLDLSPLLPILFSASEVPEELAEYCDVVRVAAVAVGEKEASVKDILNSMRKTYGLKELNVTEEVMSGLVAKSSVQVSELADEFAKYLCSESGVTTVGMDIMETVSKDMKPAKIKFGF